MAFRESFALPLLFGALSGALAGLMGVGGGILLVPLLVHSLRRSQHEAQGTSLAFIIGTALVASIPYVRHDTVPWSLVGVLALGGIPGVMTGAALAKRTPAARLAFWFGIAMLAAAARLLFAPPLVSQGVTWAAPWNALLGFGIGTIAGLLGVGGGVFLVPALVLGQGLGQHTAQGVSLALIVPVAVVGAFSYARHGHAEWRLLPALFAGGAVGGWLGATWAHALDAPLLTRFFAVFLLAVAVRMIVSSRTALSRNDAATSGGTA
jgi:uncharacterized membrane protein YfcA